MSSRRFPILKGREECPFTWIPWDVIEEHRKQAEENHGQTLERLAQRGGLDPGELFLALNNLEIRTPAGITREEHWRRSVRRGIERIIQLRTADTGAP